MEDDQETITHTKAKSKWLKWPLRGEPREGAGGEVSLGDRARRIAGTELLLSFAHGGYLGQFSICILYTVYSIDVIIMSI